MRTILEISTEMIEEEDLGDYLSKAFVLVATFNRKGGNSESAGVGRGRDGRFWLGRKRSRWRLRRYGTYRIVGDEMKS